MPSCNKRDKFDKDKGMVVVMMMMMVVVVVAVKVVVEVVVGCHGTTGRRWRQGPF